MPESGDMPKPENQRAVGPAADTWTVRVADVGARYGIHPTWRGVEAPMAYVMFEPEPTEAARLTRKYADQPGVRVVRTALGSEPDTTLKLWMTAHRGYISANRPNPDSLWFGTVRPGEGIVEGTIEVPATTLDHYRSETGLQPDFLKVDVEGQELRVLQGATRSLERCLALRVELQFDDSFEKQTASDLLCHLVDGCGFRLMRFDYDGRGQPLSYLTVDGNWGAICGCDAVFVRTPHYVAAWGGESAAAGLVKLAVFALKNGMSDYSVLCLEALDQLGWPVAADQEPPLRRYLRKLFTLAATRLRASSPDGYERAAEDYERFFGVPMLTRHRIFGSDWLNPS